MSVKSCVTAKGPFLYSIYVMRPCEGGGGEKAIPLLYKGELGKILA